MIKAGISQRLVGYLMAVVAAILFGLNGNFSRLLFDDGVSPITLLELRMLIGGLGLLIVLLVWDRRALKLYVLFAVCLSFGGVILLTGIWQQSLNGLDGLGLIFAGLYCVHVGWQAYWT